MTSAPNFSARAMASDDLPDAVGPRIATSGSVDASTDLFDGAAQRFERVAESIKETSNNESADRARITPQSEASPQPELPEVSLGGAYRQIVQKDKTQLDEGAGECRGQRLKGRGGSDRGRCGAVERLLTRRALQLRLGVGNGAVAHN